MKKVILSIFAILLLAAAAFAAGPTLLKRTVQVTPRRFLRYWKNPKAAEPVYNTYSWIPRINFEILGPIEGGSKIYVEFDKPDGSRWMTVNMRTPELEDDIWEEMKSDDPGDDVLEKQAILDQGAFKFRIKMKNALNGTDATLFAGTFKVGTYLLDQNIPDYKGKKDFFIDYDWHLPMAYLWLNPTSDENVPQLATQVCLRGNVDSAKLEAYLFYKAKQISKVSGSSNSQRQIYTSAADEPSHRWAIWEFTFPTVRGFNKSESANDWSGQFFLDKNPGEYEIKVMRDNQLSRSVKFTVGKDGKIVDNSVAKAAALGGVRMIVPAKVLGTGDGQYNAAAWQTDALFGNPLVGFTP
jgi:hypothetical protein